MEWWHQLSTDFSELDVIGLVLSLAIALVMGQILGWHFVRFAHVLSNRRKFARIFVFISATTLLMITVVKTSLALSLGLVGALSIIRFRTPIKEPEELAYLFMAIAVGVGLGADERAATLIVFVVVLVFLALLFPRGFARLPNGATRDPHGRLLARAFLFAMGITLAGVAAFGIERVRPHYMYPLILFPVFFFARIRAAGVDARAANRFAVLAVALSLVVPASVLVKYAMDPLRDGKAYLHMPYDAFARQFRAAGFRQGTILGDWLR